MTAVLTAGLWLVGLLNPASAQTSRVVQEGISTTKNSILIATTTPRVYFSTRSYGGGLSNVGVYTSSNIVVSNNNANRIVLYATGSITVNGNVGIGMSAPASVLQITTNGVTQGFLGTSGIHIGDQGSNNQLGQISFGYSNSGGNLNAPSALGYITTTQTGQTFGDLWFATRNVNTDTAPTERLRINGAGDVGIGTTGPGLTGFNRAITISAGTAGNVNAGLELQGARTVNLVYSGIRGFHKTNNVNGIDFLRDGADDAGATVFLTQAAAGALTERMRIASGGNVGIGDTNPGQILSVNGGVKIAGTGSPATGGALCLNASNVLSKCTSSVDVNGNCTCP